MMMNSIHTVHVATKRKRFKFRQPKFAILGFVLLSFLWFSCGDDTPASKPPVNHTVTFETNGGSTVAQKKVADGKKLEKPASPTRATFYFAGWYTDNTSFLKEYNFDTPVTKDLTLYAHWVTSPHSIKVHSPAGLDVITADVMISNTLQLSISTTPGPAGKAVTWEITDNDATKSKGTISDTGLYTAPATIPVAPATATVMIKATSKLDVSKTAEFTVTLISNEVAISAAFKTALMAAPNNVPASSFNTAGDKLIVTPALAAIDKLDFTTATTLTDADLALIGNFTGLKTLTIKDNTVLTTLDLSKNNALTTLTVTGNDLLTGLDVPANATLTNLDASNNAVLATLMVTSNTALTSLNASNNPLLTALDLSTNTALTSLDASNNVGLLALDLSTNTALTTLTVTGATALANLNVANTALTALDLSTNTALTALDTSKNTALTALDLSKNVALTNLNVAGATALATLDMTGMRTVAADTDALNIIDGTDATSIGALTEIKVIDALKDNAELKAVKDNKATAIIKVFTAPDATSTTYTAGAGANDADYTPVVH